MPDFVETPMPEPLMRMMGLPPSLVRYLPVTAEKPLRTMRLRGAGQSLAIVRPRRLLTRSMAGSCILSACPVPRTVSGVHLALFAGKDNLGSVVTSSRWSSAPDHRARRLHLPEGNGFSDATIGRPDVASNADLVRRRRGCQRLVVQWRPACDRRRQHRRAILRAPLCALAP
jgi:hypothetical protein